MLDIEYNPSGATCYGLSASAMVSWVSDFVDTYKAATGRDPLIYTTDDWWSTCTGNSGAFSGSSPLVLARYGSSPGTIPGGGGIRPFGRMRIVIVLGGIVMCLMGPRVGW